MGNFFKTVNETLEILSALRLDWIGRADAAVRKEAGKLLCLCYPVASFSTPPPAYVEG